MLMSARAVLSISQFQFVSPQGLCHGKWAGTLASPLGKFAAMENIGIFHWRCPDHPVWPEQKLHLMSLLLSEVQQLYSEVDIVV